MRSENKSVEEFVSHPLIENDELENRSYQDHLVKKGLKDSTLITLPTGTGKTIVTLRISANRLHNFQDRNGVCLLLAPTKPLVEQHAETYKELLDISKDEIVVLSGEIKPKQRENIWKNPPSIIISTPQVIENDILSNRINLKNVIHLTFDECHRAKGDYAYTYIADKYTEQAEDKLITGLSASPGDSKEEILTVCDNINVTSIEVLSEDDDRVSPYIFNTNINQRRVEIDDEVLEIRDILQEVYKDRLKKLYKQDYIDTRSKTTSVGKLQRVRKNILNDIQKGDDNAYSAMSIWAEAMKISQGIKKIETQGVESFIRYYERIESETKSSDSSKASERLVSDPEIRKCVKKAQSYDGTYRKFQATLAEVVRTVDQEDGKVLIFAESRDTVECLYDFLGEHFEVSRLVGQSNKENSDGMTQKDQKEAISDFEKDNSDVLISTQVGEEGLDIPQVDLVLLYEPVTRGIEWIQRIGRTGRTAPGRVIILVAEKTRDVAMYYKTQNQLDNIKKDYENLKDIEDLSEEIENELREEEEQTDLFEFDSQNSSTNERKPVVYADSRELNSSVVKSLDTDDTVRVEIENNMSVGDFVVGPETVVERKSASDFYHTITSGDRDLFGQIKNMVNSYDESILILEEGHGKLYSMNIHKNAIQSAIASIICDFGVTVFETIDQDDTAEMIAQLAKRKQLNNETTVNPHGDKDTATIKDQQEYIVSSIEIIGPKTAQSLLDECGSVHDVFTATKEELMEAEDIGEKRANKIYNIIREEYDSGDR